MDDKKATPPVESTKQPDTKPVKEADAPVKNERLSEIEKDIKPFR